MTIDVSIPQIRATIKIGKIFILLVTNDAGIDVGIVAIAALHFVCTHIFVRAAAKSAGDQHSYRQSQSSRKFFHCLNFHLRARDYEKIIRVAD